MGFQHEIFVVVCLFSCCLVGLVVSVSANPSNVTKVHAKTVDCRSYKPLKKGYFREVIMRREKDEIMYHQEKNDLISKF